MINSVVAIVLIITGTVVTISCHYWKGVHFLQKKTGNRNTNQLKHEQFTDLKPFLSSLYMLKSLVTKVVLHFINF